MKLKYLSTSTINEISFYFDGDEKLKILADLFRINTLYAITKAGSGHIGSSFSAMDIMTWLWIEEMNDPNGNTADGDIFFSSKGHDVPALYAILVGTGRLSEAKLHELRRLGGVPGHPDVSIPYFKTNTGSLGMGISKALGFLSARKLAGRGGRIFVITGDGELQEGQIWESLQPTVNRAAGDIIVIVDNNKIQSDTWVKDTSDNGDIEAKFNAFGWKVGRVDGHDVGALRKKLQDLQCEPSNSPIVIIADTIKGKGVPFMQTLVTAEDGTYYKFHSGAPNELNYQKALEELLSSVNPLLAAKGLPKLKFEESIIPEKPVLEKNQRLVSAYSDELLKMAADNKNIVALDADLVLDTGLIPFKSKYPERYFECGIAEQHMVSMSGAMASEGLLPIVHSFACFLTTRAQEQIFNNATENSKIIYVGSLAGVLPSGPGHSHQSLRDVAIMETMPSMTVIEPATEDEVRCAVRWAIRDAKYSVYIRLISIPIEFDQVPFINKWEEGCGNICAGSKGPMIVAHGAVMLSEALKAYEILKYKGIDIMVVSAPWWNRFNTDWWGKLVNTCDKIFILENTNPSRSMREVILRSRMTGKVLIRNVPDVPPCGQNMEVLSYLQLDGKSISEWILSNI